MRGKNSTPAGGSSLYSSFKNGKQRSVDILTVNKTAVTIWKIKLDDQLVFTLLSRYDDICVLECSGKIKM